MKIWEKYFIKETLKGAAFFLISFYGLYVLIDYASHSGSFHHHHVKMNIAELFLFYLAEFFRRAEVLIPVSILIGTLRTLIQLNVHHELVALQASGVPKSRLMRPFILVGLMGVVALLLITEWIEPYALKQERSIETSHIVEQSSKETDARVHSLKLEDGSTLLFQKYDRNQNHFYDLVWIRTANDIYRMKELAINDSGPQGSYVERLKRNEGMLTLQDRKQKVVFEDLKFSPSRLLETVVTPEERSISQLFSEAKANFSSEKETHIFAVFLRKLLLPWLALLVVIGAIPLAIKVTRDLNVFSIYALSLFGLVFTYIIVNAGTTLAERQVMNPYFAIVLPFAMIALGLISRFYGAVRS